MASPISATLTRTNASVIATEASLPLVPWRDPHAVPAKELAAYIHTLERACLADPQSANLRTCLGMAYAVNYQVDQSMDALEHAVGIDPDNFWARLKYAELHYRLRVLDRAEEETRHAVQLAADGWQLAIARKQLQEIRTLKHSSVRNVHWTKPLTAPTLVVSGMLLAVFVMMMWR
jgi:tetratricopeptide (TPR) repeat protein